MKLKFLYFSIALMLITPANAQSTDAADTETKQIEKPVVENKKEFSKVEGLTWENKKFSIGLTGLSGMMWVGSSFLALNPLAQLNVRYMITPHILMSLHGSFNFSIVSDEIFRSHIGHMLPLFLNIGYGNYEKNFFWFVEGGAGTEIQYLGPLFDINMGIEWLIMKSYSIGLKFTAGIFYRNFQKGYYDIDSFGIISLSANLVF